MRNNRPMPKTSAPRKIVCFAMVLRSIPFSRNFSVTKANDTPAKKMKSGAGSVPPSFDRSEEHTSELQSRLHLVCRLLLEKKKKHLTLKVSIQYIPAATFTQIHDSYLVNF